MSVSTTETLHGHEVADDSAPVYQQLPELHQHDPDRIVDLPLYREHDTGPHLTLQDLCEILSDSGRAIVQDSKLWQTFIDCNPGWTASQSEGTVIERGLFSAIDAGQQDVIDLMIENDLVTANTILTSTQETPLLRAIAVKNVAMVRRLLELGADKNGYGVVGWGAYCNIELASYYGISMIRRTPLQLAASLGHLVLVRLLIEQYQCDDSLVAPDGQIAIRLAAENGHSEVVDYLPARRGGGFRRWKHKNQDSIKRIRKAFGNMAKFLKFFIWDIEKFFLWTVPKHTVIKPIAKACNWCYKNINGFGPWCKRQILSTPVRIKTFGKWIKRSSITVGKGFWKFLTEILPKIAKGVLRWSWQLLTVKIPSAMRLLAQWIIDGTKSVANYIGTAVLSLVSLASTMLEAAVSFFRRVTLADVWNGLREVLTSIFVAFPKLLGSWIVAFGEGSYKMLKLLFGWVGQGIWFLGLGIGWILIYLPQQVWKILQSVGGVFARAGYELRVWINPKAI